MGLFRARQPSSFPRPASVPHLGGSMNIASLFQPAGRLLNDLASQVSTDPAQTQAATTATQSTGKLSVVPTTATGDHFTPSQQSAGSNTAGDAGLFQVQQSRLAPTQPTATAVQQPAATTQSFTTQSATTSAASTASATPAVSSTSSGDANSAATNTAVTNPDSPQTQQALQSLNSSLASLGLTSAEIAAFDQYASVLLQFDPNALQDLQSQLNLLATQYTTNGGGNAAAQPAATNTASAATAAPTPAASAASATTAANSAATSASAVPLLNAAQSAAASSANANPAFELAAFSITFGAPGPSSSQSQSGNPNAQSQTTPPIGLTIVEASVTLNNPAGQSVQLQSPSSSAPAAAKTAAA
jgi:trimeric autotransporter adhesin